MAVYSLSGDFYTHVEEEVSGSDGVATSRKGDGEKSSVDEVPGGCLTLRYPLRWNREIKSGDAEDERLLLFWRLFMMQYVSRFVNALRKDWLERKKRGSTEGLGEEQDRCCKTTNCRGDRGDRQIKWREAGEVSRESERGWRKWSERNEQQGKDLDAKWWDDADERFLRAYDDVEIPYSHPAFNTEHKRTVARIEGYRCGLRAEKKKRKDGFCTRMRPRPALLHSLSFFPMTCSSGDDLSGEVNPDTPAGPFPEVIKDVTEASDFVSLAGGKRFIENASSEKNWVCETTEKQLQHSCGRRVEATVSEATTASESEVPCSVLAEKELAAAVSQISTSSESMLEGGSHDEPASGYRSSRFSQEKERSSGDCREDTSSERKTKKLHVGPFLNAEFSKAAGMLEKRLAVVEQFLSDALEEERKTTRAESQTGTGVVENGGAPGWWEAAHERSDGILGGLKVIGREVSESGLSLFVEIFLPLPKKKPEETGGSPREEKVQFFIQPWLPTSHVSSSAPASCSRLTTSTRSPESSNTAAEHGGLIQDKTVPSSLDELMALEVAAEAWVMKDQTLRDNETQAALFRELFEQKERELLQQIGWDYTGVAPLKECGSVFTARFYRTLVDFSVPSRGAPSPCSSSGSSGKSEGRVAFLLNASDCFPWLFKNISDDEVRETGDKDGREARSREDSAGATGEAVRDKAEERLVDTNRRQMQSQRVSAGETTRQECDMSTTQAGLVVVRHIATTKSKFLLADVVTSPFFFCPYSVTSVLRAPEDAQSQQLASAVGQSCIRAGISGARPTSEDRGGFLNSEVFSANENTDSGTWLPAPRVDSFAHFPSCTRIEKGNTNAESEKCRAPASLPSSPFTFPVSSGSMVSRCTTPRTRPYPLLGSFPSPPEYLRALRPLAPQLLAAWVRVRHRSGEPGSIWSEWSSQPTFLVFFQGPPQELQRQLNEAQRVTLEEGVSKSRDRENQQSHGREEQLFLKNGSFFVGALPTKEPAGFAAKSGGRINCAGEEEGQETAGEEYSTLTAIGRGEERQSSQTRKGGNPEAVEVVVWGLDSLGELDEMSLTSHRGLGVPSLSQADELRPDLLCCYLPRDACAGPGGFTQCPSLSLSWSPSSSSCVLTSSRLFRSVPLPRRVAGLSGNGVNALLFTDGSVLVWNLYDGRQRREVVGPQWVFPHPSHLTGDSESKPVMWAKSKPEDRLKDCKLEPVFVSAVATGPDALACISATGELFLAGNSRCGQCCAFTDFVEQPKLVDLAVLTKQLDNSIPVIQVALNAHSVLALTASGKVYGWGAIPTPFEEQLAFAGLVGIREPYLYDFSSLPAVGIAAGPKTYAAVTADGGLWTWGDGADWQLGHGEPVVDEGHVADGGEVSRCCPKQVTFFRSLYPSLCIVGVAMGSRHSVVIDALGNVRRCLGHCTLYTWGRSNKGQCGHGDKRTRQLPQKVDLDSFLEAKTGEVSKSPPSRATELPLGSADSKLCTGAWCGASHTVIEVFHAGHKYTRFYAFGENRHCCLGITGVPTKCILRPLEMAAFSSFVFEQKVRRISQDPVVRRRHEEAELMGANWAPDVRKTVETYVPRKPGRPGVVAFSCGPFHNLAVVQRFS
ncbi:ultraviolet-b receptor uvr8 isoform x1 [Cystoisospora suis]|uniref:Ultraviolet-b receptor uvr8 isoform x1 n=1 Tax=Cystoisospora suis TaxID=483139 RepID=A0A2C6LEC1_9APIC|nr:ultraviolet-b receptor uvr8 isoform x1 [Cystoisospora suis]